jgi:DNA polymerase-3 subunit delta'
MSDWRMISDTPHWFDPQWSSLTAQIDSGRLPHAMLWITPDGIGTEALAMQFLQRIMCTSVIDTKACGHCKHCTLFEAQTHPDFYHLTPEEKSKVIKIEQVRSLIDKLLERPYQGGKRLVYMAPADLLNRAAANAFLKTLEEPGEDTYLLLLTSRPEALPATIRSRCQISHFKAPSAVEAVTYVQGRTSESAKLITQAVKLAQNRPLLAMDMLNSGQFQARSDFYAYLASVSAGQIDPLALTAGYKTPEQVIDACNWLYSLMHDAEKQLGGFSTNELTNSDQSKLIALIIGQSAELRKLWLDKLNEAKRLMSNGTNVNPVLTMESLMTGWIAFSSN